MRVFIQSVMYAISFHSTLSPSPCLSLTESFSLCRRDVYRNNLRSLGTLAIQDHFNPISGTKIFWITLITQSRAVIWVVFFLLHHYKAFRAQKIYHSSYSWQAVDSNFLSPINMAFKSIIQPLNRLFWNQKCPKKEGT